MKWEIFSKSFAPLDSTSLSSLLLVFFSWTLWKQLVISLTVWLYLDLKPFLTLYISRETLSLVYRALRRRILFYNTFFAFLNSFIFFANFDESLVYILDIFAMRRSLWATHGALNSCMRCLFASNYWFFRIFDILTPHF